MWKYNRYVEVPLVYGSLLPQVAAEGKEWSYLLVEMDGENRAGMRGWSGWESWHSCFSLACRLKENMQACQFGVSSGARKIY